MVVTVDVPPAELVERLTKRNAILESRVLELEGQQRGNKRNVQLLLLCPLPLPARKLLNKAA